MIPEVPIIILILSIPVYFLTIWILKRLRLGNKKNRKFLAFIPTMILSPLLYFGLIMIWVFSVSYYPETDFNSQEWNENKEERFKMSNNIIKCEILIGKNKKEVIELLGNDFYSYNENHIAYDLGFVPGLLKIDPDVLDIYFENGKVIRVSQHET